MSSSVITATTTTSSTAAKNESDSEKLKKSQSQDSIKPIDSDQQESLVVVEPPSVIEPPQPIVNDSPAQQQTSKQEQQQTSTPKSVLASPSQDPVKLPDNQDTTSTKSTLTTTTTTTTIVTKKKEDEAVTSKNIPLNPSITSKIVIEPPVLHQPIPAAGSSSPTHVQPLSSLSPYKSQIAPRQTVISRRNVDRSYTSNLINGSPISMRPNLSQLSFGSPVQSAAGLALKESRQKEKQQLSELNDRFAGYVERVRFLEAQNKKLQLELGILKGKWGQETKQIEKMYQIEIDEARSVLNDTSKVKDNLRVKLERSEQELEVIRTKYSQVEAYLNNEKQKIKDLQEQIAANESEIGLLRRRLQDLQDEEKRYKQEAHRMMNEIQRVSSELECEMKQRLMLENDKQSLEEELLFIKEIHAKELEELKHLALQDAGLDPSLFFKSELANAIREIRQEYESLNQTQRTELEGWYRIKVSLKFLAII